MIFFCPIFSKLSMHDLQELRRDFPEPRRLDVVPHPLIPSRLYDSICQPPKTCTVSRPCTTSQSHLLLAGLLVFTLIKAPSTQLTTGWDLLDEAFRGMEYAKTVSSIFRLSTSGQNSGPRSQIVQPVPGQPGSLHHRFITVSGPGSRSTVLGNTFLFHMDAMP